MTSFFDLLASEYDATFSDTAVGRLQRQRVHHFVQPWLLRDPPLRILEINCGTGIDALWMSRQGHEVVATDASIRMIEICNEKIKTSGHRNPPAFVQCSFEDLRNRFGGQTFDLIFSNFGGLNCIDRTELTGLARDASGILNPQGHFIAVIMGRKCLWERVYYSFKRDPAGKSRRRSASSVEVSLHAVSQPTWYYSPPEIKEIFEAFFIPYSLKPVGFFIPPSYLNPFFRNKRYLLAALNLLEKLFPFSSLADHSDHYFISFRKKQSP